MLFPSSLVFHETQNVAFRSIGSPVDRRVEQGQADLQHKSI